MPSKNSPMWRSAIALLLLASPLSPAQSANRSILEDAKLYVTAPLRWDGGDWLMATGSLLGIAASHHYDASVRARFADDGVMDTGDAYSTEDALPTLAVLAGTGVLAFAMRDSGGYHEAFNMLEAGAFSVATTFVLKELSGRQRPNVTDDPNAWFEGGDSFPSRHVTVAMAVGTVLAESGGEDYRWIRRGLGYGLGLGTMYLRMKHQQHWLSDTVAGAALGFTTARFVLNRDNTAGTFFSSLMLMPADDGVMLSYATTFR